MANTYYQCYVHFVFAAKLREGVICVLFHEKIQNYICGIVSRDRNKIICIYSKPDYIYDLAEIRPFIPIFYRKRNNKSGFPERNTYLYPPLRV